MFLNNEMCQILDCLNQLILNNYNYKYYYIESVPSLNGYSYQLLCINTFYTRNDFLKVNTNFIETNSFFFFLLHILKSLRNI